MFHKLLVPLDGSELAERALPVAASLLPATGGEMILLTVPALHPVSRASYGGYMWLYPDQANRFSREQALAYLASISRRCEREGVTFRHEVISGDPAGVIVDQAARLGADAIVMTTRGYSGLTRWTLGSVSEKVMRGATSPVVVVREPRPLRRILVPLDGSEHGERALPHAFWLARENNARLTLLYVVEPFIALTPSTLGWEHVAMQIDETATEKLAQQATAYLENVATRYSTLDFEAEPVVLHGPTAETILQYAEESGADLIAMATHGRTGLRRWVYGSVTEKVLRGVHSSLLVVRVPPHLLHEEPVSTELAHNL